MGWVMRQRRIYPRWREAGVGMSRNRFRGWRSICVFACLAILPWSFAHAVRFKLANINGQELRGNLNSQITAGVGVRMQNRSARLVGKGDLNPNVCAPPYQSCQGVFKGQIFPAQHLAAAPGAPSINYDDGDLNYDQYDIFQAPVKATEELTLKWGNFGFFGRVLYFYDFRNNNFHTYQPNEITPQNYQSVGRVTNGLDFLSANSISQLSGTLGALPAPVRNLVGQVSNVLNGTANLVLPPIRVYGPGGVVRARRTDPAILHQAGTALQYLDSFVYGNVHVFGMPLTIKIGRQTLNWGESTSLAINTINSTNPVNANNYMRVGGEIEEVFTPLNMVFASISPFANASLSAFYQLEWKPDEIYTPGTYFSDVDLGTNNAGINNNLNASFGAAALDPSCLGAIQDNPLGAITPTCLTIPRLADWKPHTGGQYGFHFDYYFPNFNNGTDVSLYYEHYHSRLPYLSLFATYPSCARSGGNAAGQNATNLAQFTSDCPDLPLTHILTGSNPAAATSDAVPFHTARAVFEYPEDIQLYGISFNTTAGKYSIQGEVAWRPNKPFQVNPIDLAFAAFGPTLSRCGQIDSSGNPIVCGPGGSGSIGGVGQAENGSSTVYGPGDFTPHPGTPTGAYNDTFNLVVGNLPGSQRSFPNYIVPYRGGTVGNNAPCYPQPGTTAFNNFVQGGGGSALNGFGATVASKYHAYNASSPCYIRGYQRFGDINFNFGATRVLGQTENWVGANQVILLYEVGAEWVPGMPAYDQLVLAGPNVATYSPTAGADGSGANPNAPYGSAAYRRACSNIPDCNAGPDGGRFNPHTADPAGFPTKFSWGYRVIAQLEYDHFIFSEITLMPLIQFKQDVGGMSPGPGGNFVKGRKEIDAMFSFIYRAHLSFHVGYTWYWGGGRYNSRADRDYAQAFVRYGF